MPNPLEPIRKLLRLVRPGGVVGFEEPDVPSGYWSTHRLTILDQVQSVMLKLIEHGMLASDLLSALFTAFDEAGITEQRITRSGAIASASSEGACAWAADTARALYGVAQRMGFPLPSYDPKTVDVDLKKELVNKNALFTPWQWFGAAGRLPDTRTAEKKEPLQAKPGTWAYVPGATLLARVRKLAEIDPPI